MTVRSVDRGLSAERDWEELADLVATRARRSSRTRATPATRWRRGTARRTCWQAARRRPVPGQAPGPPLAALAGRRQAARPLPLRAHQRQRRRAARHGPGLARDARAPAEFAAWLGRDLVWADTLVDRIVSAPIEPVGAVAEPYALWAIARRPGLADPPCRHPAIVMADDLEPYERLKLHILNLGPHGPGRLWMSEARDAGETVRAMLADPDVRGAARDRLPAGSGPGLRRRAAWARRPPPTSRRRWSGSSTLPRPPRRRYRPEPRGQGRAPHRGVPRLTAGAGGGAPAAPTLEAIVAGNRARPA